MRAKSNFRTEKRGIKDKLRKSKKRRSPQPSNRGRAICNATIATIYQGRRLVREYYSGEPLIGKIQ